MSKFQKQAETRTTAISVMESVLPQIQSSLDSGDADSAAFHIKTFDSFSHRASRAYETTPAGLADDARLKALSQEIAPLRGKVRMAQEAAAEAAAEAARVAAAEAAQKALTMLTDAQADYLRILGYTGSLEGITKSEASRMIDTYKSGRGRGHCITAEDNDDPEAFDSVRRAMRM